MTRKILLTSIIAATLILSVTSFAQQNVQAATTTVSDMSSCTGIGGIWSSPVCTVNGLTIADGDELVIDKIKLRNVAEITNEGTITVLGGNNSDEGQLLNGNNLLPVGVPPNVGKIINNSTGTINLVGGR